MPKRAADPLPELPRLLKLALWLGVVGAIALAIHQTKPPPALGESAPPIEFSAARAKGHLLQIAREPHPIGTGANERVRSYLVQQLQALGAEVHVEATVGVTHSGKQIYAGTTGNIVATLPGTANAALSCWRLTTIPCRKARARRMPGQASSRFLRLSGR